MNCDDAFDRLTDPKLADDSELAAHLARCPRCREMRETLSPALEWLSAERDVDNSGTAWPRGGTASPLLTAHALQVAEQVARDLPRRRMSRTAWLRQLATIAAVAVVGMAVGAYGIDSQREHQGLSAAGDGSMLTACLWNTPTLRHGLPDTTARGVVVSCVMCHVPTSVE